MNKVVLLGRLTKDIEIKQAGTTDVARFTLAVNRPFKKDETDFLNCVAFGKTAETLEKYVKKGHQLAVHGRIQVSNYEKDGEKRYSTDIVVEGFDFISAGHKEETTPNKNNSFGAELEPIDNEDMPF